MHFTEQYKKLLQKPFYLFIRHGERFDIKQGDLGAEALLTPRGEKDAYALGQLLKDYAPFRVFSSTVQRCVDTGSHILSGAGLKENVSPQNFLAEGYIQDFKMLLEADNTINFEKILRTYMSEGQYPGLYSLKEGSENLLRNFQSASENKSAVFVSHDAVIMPFIKYYTGKDISNEWLGFLSGVLIPMDSPQEMIQI